VYKDIQDQAKNDRNFLSEVIVTSFSQRWTSSYRDKDLRILWRFQLNHKQCWTASWNRCSRNASSNGRGTGPGV
jgi:hypothetical protein